MDKYVEILSLRASGLVSRWHTVPTLHIQNVAEHSGQAVSLLLMLHPSPSLNLIKAMLWHDTSERECGDVPAPVRRASKALSDAYEREEYRFSHDNHPVYHEASSSLSYDEVSWLKAIDVLELVLYCHDEMMLGNSRFAEIAKRGKKYLADSDRTPPEVIGFLSWFVENGPRSFA